MPIDDRTTNRSYKLPNAGTLLSEDVQRLRDALTAIDADVFARYTKTETDQKLADLINGAPGALDTLNELAAAMGNDPNFATTITNALAGKPGFADVWTRTQADARYVQGITQTENVFTGTGSQTTFTLTQTPPTRESLLVTVDGVVQPTTAYNLSGSALILSEAPASGASIRVLMLGVAGPVQSASTLSFTPAGAGAVTRTVDSKLKDWVSVTDFGATGDGTTDDTSAVQAAFNSGATAVYFPKASSKYAVGQITVPTTVKHVFGPGVIRQRANNADIFIITSSTGCIFDGLFFEGNWSNGLALQPSSDNNAIEAVTCSNIVVRNCYFKRIGFHAVWLKNCKDSVVTGNIIFECGPAIYLQGSQQVSVANNVINQPITADTVFTIGIALESTDGHAYGINQNVTIQGNVVRNYKNAQGIMAHSGANISIVSNVVDQSILGISINPYNATDDCTRIQIVGNTVSSPTSLAGYSGGNDGIICQAGGATPNITDVTIAGNTVTNYNRAENAAGQGGIRVGYTKRVTISGNTITSAQRNGIVLTSAEEGIVITGNNIAGVIEGGSTQNGIAILAAARGVISGNYFDNFTGANGTGINFSVASLITLGHNNFTNIATNVTNGQHEQPPKSKTITTTGASVSVDLSGVDIINFNQNSASTITSFTGVVPGKLYKFYFQNGNTTIDRSAAWLNGSASQTGTADDVMLVYGRTTTTIAQAAPMSVNG